MHEIPELQIGVLAPHFGSGTNPERILRAGGLIEELGFDSVWVRDHLLWKPHGIEGTARTFVEPLAVLNSIGATTRRITLGTAVIIPLRWPMKLAQDLAALEYLHGSRVIAGLGTGSNHAELAAAGFDAAQRRKIVSETAAIMRALWARDDVAHAGEVFTFENASIEPKPARPIPLWYGGTTASAIKFAAAGFDGWIGGRTPIRHLKALMDQATDLEGAREKPLRRGMIQLVQIHRRGKRPAIEVDPIALAMSTEGAHQYEGYSDQDLRGAISTGDPSQVAESLAELVAVGIDHMVIDLRLQFETFERDLELIAKDVLPTLRRAVPRSGSTI